MIKQEMMIFEIVELEISLASAERSVLIAQVLIFSMVTVVAITIAVTIFDILKKRLL